MIQILSESIIRSIAAGEVIERPSSVIRELIENAIDAKADCIELSLWEGGIKKIILKDNGKGMSQEDLDICLFSHTTSKISRKEDLLSIKTLGFRGEALSSICACSRIKIESTQEKGKGKSIEAENGEIIKKQELLLFNIGTMVEVEDLFFYLPARRRFLKKSHIEYLSCRSTFEDISLCHPEINFKMFKEKNLESFYPKTELKERVADVWSDFIKKEDLIFFSRSTDHLSYEFIGTKPSLTRKDRKFIKIFINGRRVEDSSLIQAILKGYEGYLPGGFFPYATLHLKINPDMVDFNIHPSKKEVRFLHLPHLIGFLIKSLRDYFHENMREFIPSFEMVEDYSFLEKAFQSNSFLPSTLFKEIEKEEKNFYLSNEREENSPKNLSEKNIINEEEAFLVNSNLTTNEEVKNNPSFNYLGQFAKRYLIVELEEKLVLIDQHAAHERILFEKFKKESHQTQKLLLPYPFAMQNEPLKIEQIKQLSKIGIIIELNIEDPSVPIWEYHITELPKLCSSMEEIIVDFIKNDVFNNIVTDIFFKLYSNLACKNAIKSGDILNEVKAIDIISEILNQQWFSCPHGRPLWLEFKKSYFDNLIKRT